MDLLEIPMYQIDEQTAQIYSQLKSKQSHKSKVMISLSPRI